MPFCPFFDNPFKTLPDDHVSIFIPNSSSFSSRKFHDDKKNEINIMFWKLKHDFDDALIEKFKFSVDFVVGR